MGLIPEGARLVDAGDLWFPIVVVENVHIFPGIPELLQKKFESMRERFRGIPFQLKRVYVNLPRERHRRVAERAADRVSRAAPRLLPADRRTRLPGDADPRVARRRLPGARARRTAGAAPQRGRPQGRVAGPDGTRRARPLAGLRPPGVDGREPPGPAAGVAAGAADAQRASARHAPRTRFGDGSTCDWPRSAWRWRWPGSSRAPLSSIFLRDWTPFERAHGWIGLAAAGLFVATAIVGRRIERGQSRALDLHAVLALAATLAAGVAAMTGFVLLP